MSAARQALWRDARALSDAAAGVPAAPPRLRRLLTRSDPPLALPEIAPAPAWADEPEPARARLARLTGAVLVSRSWSRAISGAVLGRAAEAVGDEALEALINLPDLLAPAVADAKAAKGDPCALDRLGAAALLSAAELSPGARARWARRLPGGARADRPIGSGLAATAQRTAEGVRLSVEGVGEPDEAP